MIIRAIDNNKFALRSLSDLDLSNAADGAILRYDEATQTWKAIVELTNPVAEKLETPRAIAISGGVTGTATDFDGSQNISIPVTAIDADYINDGAVAVAHGGTGATTAADALKNLGLTATATELNYTDGVSANIQVQLNGKAPTEHAVTTTEYGVSSATEYGHAKASSTTPIVASTASVGTETATFARGDHVHPAQTDVTGNAGTATTLQTARNIALSGAVTGTATAFDGSSDITIPTTSVDATKLTGMIPLESIPQSALERLVIVQDDEARFALTSAEVQKGDTVKVNDTGLLYFVVDDTKLSTSAGYSEYTAGQASSVPWSGITDVPTAFNPTSHAVATTVYGVSSANNYGHARASTTVPLVASTASVGNETEAFARGDHVHPAQTDVTGNAGTATALQNARTIALSGAVTGTATEFDGTANITIPVTSVDTTKLSSTVAISQGGTGATTAEDALSNLGITATATELNLLDGVTATTTEINYLDGVTSSIQTQLGEKAPLSHASTSTTYGAASATNYGHAMASSTVPKANGAATAGAETSSFARGDHVHPVQTTVSGNAGTATALETARNIDGILFDGTNNAVHYAVCSTASEVGGKTVDCTGFTLANGSRIVVKFANTNTAVTSSLNVNGTGSKALYFNGAPIGANVILANSVHEFVYDGTNYVKVGDFNTDTTYTLETIGGVLPVTSGGTGATTAAGALTNLGLTATAAELNVLDGATVTASELNLLDGALVSTEEINYLAGTTSDIQTQLNGKAPTSHASSGTEYGVATISAYGHAMASQTKPKVAGSASVGTETTKFARGDHVHPAQTTITGNAGTATTLETPRNISITGAVTGTATAFDGSADIAIDATSVDATKLNGIIPIENLPASAVERLLVVATDQARYELTSNEVQVGDTVKVESTGLMYFVVNVDELDSDEGYEEYTVGSASSVPWSGITGVPSEFNPTSHASTTTEYGVASTSNYGHAKASTTTPIVAGVADTGSETSSFARGDHVHPAQTSVSGNAGTATALQTPRTIALSGAVTGTATAFDGSENITIETTSVDISKLSATIPLTQGGTGATTAEGALTNLGLTATAEELNYMDGVTSAVQTQLNGKAPTSHASATTTYGVASDSLYGHAMASSTVPLENGAATIGTEVSTFARGDHVHPLQTSVSGNAGTATALATGRTIAIHGAVTGSTTQLFDGTTDVSINATSVDATKLSGTIAVAQGGTGATTAEGALENLGLTATATELNVLDGVNVTTAEINYLDGVTSPIQTQINEKADVNHASTSTTYGAASETNYGHAKASATTPKAAGTATVGTETSSFARGDHVHPVQTSVSGNAGTATTLETPRTIALSGAVTGTATSFDGSENITIPTTSVDATKLVGTISVSNLPASAFERFIVVEDNDALYALTTDDVSLGDTVKVQSTGMMYFVVDINNLDNANGYEEYTVGSASSVPWSGVTDKPTEFNPTSHASTTTEYGVSNATNYGHAKASTTTPIVAGTAAVGTETGSFARGDHVHPAQTDVTGNAGTATTLETPRTIGLSGAVTGTATAFDGSEDITIATTSVDATKLSGTVAIANGGTGATTAEGALTNLGLTATAEELNYMDGVTSAVQTQLNGKAPTSHATTATTYGVSTASNYGHAKASGTTPKLAGTASVGTETGSFARGDHVHPAQTSVTGNAGTATALETARTIDGVSFDGSAAITHYGVCSTAAGTVAKDVDCDGFVLTTGSRIAVMFTNGNTASLPTLNVNNTGDVAIFYENAAVNPEYLSANRIHEFIYDGTHFVKVGDFNTTNEYTLDNITGVLPVANGGTGATTADGALTNLGLTATATEINKLDGMTASTDELNILDGALVSTTELNYLDGVTSAVQTQINGKAPTSHASTATTYGVSSASNYGHAMASGTTPKAAGTATVGTETAKFARGDHVHPAQTTITGNAGTASALETPRNISITGAVTGTATAFDGSEDISITTTSLDVTKLSGTVAIAQGGTGATTAEDALTNLGLTATAAELNYMDGVTSAVQTQINGKAPTSHASSATTYGVSTASNYGHAKASGTTPKVAGTAAVGSETSSFARGDHVHPAQTTITGNAGTATALETARTIALSGAATGTATSFDGSENITIPVTSIDATKLSGVIPLENLPPSAVEKLVIVADDTARFALTTSQVQIGDTVKVESTGLMYFVIDTSELDNNAGYEEYTASTASSVPWTGVTGVPSEFNPSSHASTSTTYGVASASNYGHAKASGTTPKAAGTATVGTETGTFARGDHVHPAQTDVTGNAGTANALASAVNIALSGAVTGTATAFDGSADITIPTTSVDATKLSGAVAVANGGTGATTAEGALTNLGLTATATELNYMDGVTSAVQTQLNGKAPTSHASADTTYGISTASNYGHAMASTTTPKAAGTAAVGSETAKFARGDHVHPLQTTVSGNAGTATTLETARSIALSGAVTGTATDFDGSEDIVIPTTSVDATKLSGAVAIANGGTGATTAADALTNLGLTATASELNYMDGVTSAVQTQIDGKAPTSHASTDTTYGAASASNYGHAKASATTPIVAGTAAVGSETDTFARGDHVHPAQTSVSGNAGTATTLATARAIDGVNFNGGAAIVHFTTCSTAAGTVAKTASLTGFVLTTGSLVYVMFSNANSATNPTLNINSTGAKAMYSAGERLTGSKLTNGVVYAFIYDGTQYQSVGGGGGGGGGWGD